MSEINNGRLGLYGAKHSKCNDMTAVLFKGLTTVVVVVVDDNVDVVCDLK